MNLALDVREACRRKRAGKGNWTYQFVTELVKRDIALTFLSDEKIPTSWDAPNVDVKYFSRGLSWHRNVAQFLRASKNIDLYVSPTSYIVPALLGNTFPYVPIVHDLIAFRREPHDRKATLIERLTLGRTIKNARHICTVSESTKNDLLKKYSTLDPSLVTPIFAGPLREMMEKENSHQKIILCIATLSPRKNQLRLIQAYASLPEDLRRPYELVLAGSRGWHDQDIVNLAKKTAGVRMLEYVSDEQYESLLSMCTVFALPSLYEGFGMQILDALQHGVPILTSDRGSLREVAGESAVYCDPESVTSIATSLEKLLRDQTLRSELAKSGPVQARQFSWKRTVDLFLGAVKKA